MAASRCGSAAGTGRSGDGDQSHANFFRIRDDVDEHQNSFAGPTPICREGLHLPHRSDAAPPAAALLPPLPRVGAPLQWLWPMGSGRASGPEAGAAGDGPAAGEASAGPAGATAATTRTPMGNHEVEALPLPVVGLCSGGGEGDFFTGRSIGPTCERNPAVTTASRTHQWKGGWRMAAAAASHSGHGDDHSGGSSISGTSGRYGSGAAAEAFLSRRERPTRRSRRERRSMESGVTTVPPLFCAPTMAVPQAPSTPSPDSFTILVVDLSLPRSDTVALVRAAARSCGFFHVTNHRVPADIVGAAARAFHEQPLAACSALYSPDPVVGSVAYSTIPITQRRRRRHGVDAAPTLPWRDSLRVRFGPGEPELGGLPAWCRDALQVYQRLLKGFEEEMAGLLSEALGVGAARLEQELQVRGWLMACHYYPPCPEPTVGSLEHMDGMDGKPWDPLLEVELEGP